MRILLVIDHLDPGGSQHQMVTLATGLKRRGHDVTCFLYYPEMVHHRPALDAAGVIVASVPKRRRYGLSIPSALRKLVRSGFDVSLSYLTTPNIYNVLATLGTRVPALVSERSALLPGRIPTGTTLRYGVYRLADRILVNSQHQHERLAVSFPWMRSKLVTIRNGVDLDRYFPAPEPRTKTPEKLSLLAVGSIHTGKNFLGLIEAMKIHRERFGWTPSVRWVGRTGTRERDVRAFDQAQHMIDHHGLRLNWEWLGVRRDVPDLMRDSDALIHPSFFEGLPNVICEALACGLPVLAGAVCDHLWLVGDGERGLLFDPADPYDVAVTLGRFADMDQQETASMRARARAFAEAELSLDTLLDRYENLFSHLV